VAALESVSLEKHAKVILSNIRISDSSDMLARFSAAPRFMDAYEKGLNGKQAAWTSTNLWDAASFLKVYFRDLNELI